MLEFDPLAALSEQHTSLAQLFARHQEALVTRAWARAARLLDSYQRRLLHHIGLEERYLLPCCPTQKLAGQWPASVYAAEHRRIEDLLQRQITRLAKARRHGVSTTRLIALLDEEKTLKHLVEHHHEREDLALFVTARQALPENARLQFTRELMSVGGATMAASR